MWPNPQYPEDLVTFTEEIFNGKLYFLCSDYSCPSNGWLVFDRPVACLFNKVCNLQLRAVENGNLFPNEFAGSLVRVNYMSLKTYTENKSRIN